MSPKRPRASALRSSIEIGSDSVTFRIVVCMLPRGASSPASPRRAQPVQNLAALALDRMMVGTRLGRSALSSASTAMALAPAALAATFRETFQAPITSN